MAGAQKELGSKSMRDTLNLKSMRKGQNLSGCFRMAATFIAL